MSQSAKKNESVSESFFHFLLDEYTSSQFGNSTESVEHEFKQSLRDFSKRINTKMSPQDAGRAAFLASVIEISKIEIHAMVVEVKDFIWADGSTLDTTQKRAWKAFNARRARENLSPLTPQSLAGLDDEQHVVRVLESAAEWVVAHFLRSPESPTQRQLYLPSGSATHAVALWIDGTTNVVAICNSGEGLEFHEKNLDRGTQQLVVACKPHSESGLVLIVQHAVRLQVQRFSAFTSKSKSYANMYDTTVEWYQKVLVKAVPVVEMDDTGKTFTIPSLRRNEFFYKPQRSGSCTFYSIYYLCRYVLSPPTAGANATSSDSLFWAFRSHLFRHFETQYKMVAQRRGSAISAQDLLLHQTVLQKCQAEQRIWSDAGFANTQQLCRADEVANFARFAVLAKQALVKSRLSWDATGLSDGTRFTFDLDDDSTQIFDPKQKHKDDAHASNFDLVQRLESARTIEAFLDILEPLDSLGALFPQFQRCQTNLDRAWFEEMWLWKLWSRPDAFFQSLTDAHRVIRFLCSKRLTEVEWGREKRTTFDVEKHTKGSLYDRRLPEFKNDLDLADYRDRFGDENDSGMPSYSHDENDNGLTFTRPAHHSVAYLLRTALVLRINHLLPPHARLLPSSDTGVTTLDELQQKDAQEYARLRYYCRQFRQTYFAGDLDLLGVCEALVPYHTYLLSHSLFYRSWLRAFVPDHASNLHHSVKQPKFEVPGYSFWKGKKGWQTSKIEAAAQWNRLPHDFRVFYHQITTPNAKDALKLQLYHVININPLELVHTAQEGGGGGGEFSELFLKAERSWVSMSRLSRYVDDMVGLVERGDTQGIKVLCASEQLNQIDALQTTTQQHLRWPHFAEGTSKPFETGLIELCDEKGNSYEDTKFSIGVFESTDQGTGDRSVYAIEKAMFHTLRRRLVDMVHPNLSLQHDRTTIFHLVMIVMHFDVLSDDAEAAKQLLGALLVLVQQALGLGAGQLLATLDDLEKALVAHTPVMVAMAKTDDDEETKLKLTIADMDIYLLCVACCFVGRRCVPSTTSPPPTLLNYLERHLQHLPCGEFALAETYQRFAVRLLAQLDREEAYARFRLQVSRFVTRRLRASLADFDIQYRVEHDDLQVVRLRWRHMHQPPPQGLPRDTDFVHAAFLLSGEDDEDGTQHFYESFLFRILPDEVPGVEPMDIDVEGQGSSEDEADADGEVQQAKVERAVPPAPSSSRKRAREENPAQSSTEEELTEAETGARRTRRKKEHGTFKSMRLEGMSLDGDSPNIHLYTQNVDRARTFYIEKTDPVSLRTFRFILRKSRFVSNPKVLKGIMMDPEYLEETVSERTKYHVWHALDCFGYEEKKGRDLDASRATRSLVSFWDPVVEFALRRDGTVWIEKNGKAWQLQVHAPDMLARWVRDIPGAFLVRHTSPSSPDVYKVVVLPQEEITLTETPFSDWTEDKPQRSIRPDQRVLWLSPTSNGLYLQARGDFAALTTFIFVAVSAHRYDVAAWVWDQWCALCSVHAAGMPEWCKKAVKILSTGHFGSPYRYFFPMRIRAHRNQTLDETESIWTGYCSREAWYPLSYRVRDRKKLQQKLASASRQPYQHPFHHTVNIQRDSSAAPLLHLLLETPLPKQQLDDADVLAYRQQLIRPGILTAKMARELRQQKVLSKQAGELYATYTQLREAVSREWSKQYSEQGDSYDAHSFVDAHTAQLMEMLELELLVQTVRRMRVLVEAPVPARNLDLLASQLADVAKSLAPNDFGVHRQARSFLTVLFETASDHLIWKTQHDLFQAIQHNLLHPTKDTTAWFTSYQLLMGKGKTAVITPLLAFHLGADADAAMKSLLLLLPEHLTHQSLAMFANRFADVLPFLSVRFQTITRAWTAAPDKCDALLSRVAHPTQNALTILSDTSFKSLQLNLIEKQQQPGSYESVVTRLQRETYVLFDEVDTLQNPITSELNYPLRAQAKVHNQVGVIEPLVLDLCCYLRARGLIDTVCENFVEASRLIGQLACDFVRKSVTEKTRPKYLDALIFYLAYRTGEAPLDGVSMSEATERVQAVPHHVYIAHRVVSTMAYAMTQIYNKDYGFGSLDASRWVLKNGYIAVPYQAVGDPVNGSEFTDVTLTLILTTLAYLHQPKVRDCDRIVFGVVLVRACERSGGLERLVRMPYFVDIFRGFSLTRSDGSLLKNVELLNVDKLCDHVDAAAAESIQTPASWTQVYLRQHVFKTFVWINERQYNASFLDVACAGFTGRRVGFSGTINIAQPRYAPFYEAASRTWQMVKLAQAESQSRDTFLVPDRASNGGIRGALLGLFDPTMRVFSWKQRSGAADDAHALLEFLVREDYDVFIDVGAFLRNLSALQVVQEVERLLATHGKPARRLVFVDEHDVLQEFVVQQEGGGYLLRPWANDEPVSNVWIYYDHKHTVGIDVKQPFVMRGCVSVNFFNRTTEVAQGTFRLRNMNNGHRVDFVHFDNFASVRDDLATQLNRRMRAIEQVPVLKEAIQPAWVPIPLLRESDRFRQLTEVAGTACSREELYEFLELNERLMFLQMEQQVVLQNLKALRRLTTDVARPSAFLDDIFNPRVTEVLSAHNEHDILHQHDKWIQSSLCAGYSGEFTHAVQKLCDELRPAALYDDKRNKGNNDSAAKLQLRHLLEETHAISTLRSTNVAQAQQVATSVQVNQNVSTAKNRQMMSIDDLPMYLGKTLATESYLEFGRAQEQEMFLSRSFCGLKTEDETYKDKVLDFLVDQQNMPIGISWSKLFFLDMMLVMQSDGQGWEQKGFCYLATAERDDDAAANRLFLCVSQSEVYGLLVGLLSREDRGKGDPHVKLYNKHGLDLAALARGSVQYDPHMMGSSLVQTMLGRSADLVTRLRLIRFFNSVNVEVVEVVLTNFEAIMGYACFQKTFGEAFMKFIFKPKAWGRMKQRLKSWETFRRIISNSFQVMGIGEPSSSRSANKRFYKQLARAVEQVDAETFYE